MKFIDEVNIIIRSGHGGAGALSFRREKFVPFGGPDGGPGGRGGHVYFKANENINTLIHFRGRKAFLAPDGEKGAGQNMNGANGEDLILEVPVGTLIKDRNTGEIVADLAKHDEVVLLAQGGRGGQGNIFFKSSIRQVPMYAQPGLPGVELDLHLELKLLADIALIGLPNAGKSTLISVLSEARPKIADYPFTTLEPNLGVTRLGEKSLVLADIPGLIEGASEGKGLGIKFLKHIERTSAFVHLIDISMLIDEYEVLENYVTIREELVKYKSELENKKEIVCLTKIDALPEEEIKRFQDYLENELQKKVLPLSAVSGKNIELLKSLMFKTKETQPAPVPNEGEEGSYEDQLH